MSSETVLMTVRCWTHADSEKSGKGKKPTCRSPLLFFSALLNSKRAQRSPPVLLLLPERQEVWKSACTDEEKATWPSFVSQRGFRTNSYPKLCVDNDSLVRKPNLETIQCYFSLCGNAFCFHHGQINPQSSRRNSWRSHHRTSWRQR